VGGETQGEEGDQNEQCRPGHARAPDSLLKNPITNLRSVSRHCGFDGAEVPAFHEREEDEPTVTYLVDRNMRNRTRNGRELISGFVRAITGLSPNCRRQLY
jgi:hypothetical protein